MFECCVCLRLRKGSPNAVAVGAKDFPVCARCDRLRSQGDRPWRRVLVSNPLASLREASGFSVFDAAHIRAVSRQSEYASELVGASASIGVLDQAARAWGISLSWRAVRRAPGFWARRLDPALLPPSVSVLALSRILAALGYDLSLVAKVVKP